MCGGFEPAAKNSEIKIGQISREILAIRGEGARRILRSRTGR
jgi:hypothetical protein